MIFPPVTEQLDEIRRGATEIIPEEELVRKLERSLASGEPLRIKQGFDPTRPDLHIGHAVSISKLRDFQELGHEVIFVVGDYTAMVGDPTGRNEQRPRLSADEVAENARSYADQVFRILDPKRTRVEFNSSWLQPLRLEDVLRLTAQYTVARMLERDDFAKRFEGGVPISLVEFMYPLLQAYDSVALRADVELGGSDQRFNLLVARSIQERYGQEPQVCLLMPLLRGTDGVHKMSKSYDNYVGLADAPEEQYGRTMSVPDDLLEEWYRLASGLSGDALATALADVGRDPYATKRRLAERIVALYHGGEAAQRAADHFDQVFRRRELPDEIPVVTLDPDDESLAVTDRRVGLPRLLVRAGLASSNSQAARLIDQGAVSVDGMRAESRSAELTATGEYVLQKGKRHFVRVRFGRRV
ncbi:MAG TPA: tyrosine--tRNA ligase [Longimicrobiaceae bacterium]|nr:tyrosine--tRNA ligase [Longimicrobiaceae bacterium]